jgi:hypothetical protein
MLKPLIADSAAQPVIQHRLAFCSRVNLSFGEEKRKMKTQVEFRSDNFPPCDGEEEQINPGLWGKRLAEYLQENLPHQGLKVTSIGAGIGAGW